MKTRKSWREKIETTQEPKLVRLSPKMSRLGEGIMLVPTPRLVEDVVRRIPKGKVITVGEIRRKLAADFSADVTCPLTTGIFVRIIAEAAEEERAAGRKIVTPYWRVIKDDGGLNPKFPGGITKHGRLLRSEGFSLSRKGKSGGSVRDFDQNLFTFV